MESVFNIVIGNRLDSSNYLKELYERRFSGNLLKFSKQEFFWTSLKNAWNDFLFLVTLINDSIMDLFLQYFYYFRTLTETFFHWVCFVETRNPRLQACSIREEEIALQSFFGVFKILEHPFPFEHFQQSICNRGFSPVVGCRL